MASRALYHGFMAINPDIFRTGKPWWTGFQSFCRNCGTAPKAERAAADLHPRRKESLAYADRIENGIEVNINTVAEMKELCDYLKMDSVNTSATLISAR